MRGIVMKCVERHTVESANGPLTTVVLKPGGPLNTNTGSITIHVHDKEDLDAYQVGNEFLLKPEQV